MALCGFFNLHKPPGITSRQAADRVARLVRPAKAGHAGTLDPLASGVLVVAVGAATRLIDCVQQMPKRYTGTFLLGRSSDTEDIEGQVVELESPPVPTRAEIETAAQAMVGAIEQRPPAFSALKVQGRRAYDLARQGKVVELAPRIVQIYGIALARYDYPELVLDVRCGSGTYVRSLGRDLAERLGTAAVMSVLVRTEIGPFNVADAVLPDTLTAENLLRHLQPALLAVAMLPQIVLSPAEQTEILHGRPIERKSIPVAAGAALDGAESAEIAAVDAAGQLVALLTERAPGMWGPTRNFLQPE